MVGIPRAANERYTTAHIFVTQTPSPETLADSVPGFDAVGYSVCMMTLLHELVQ